MVSVFWERDLARLGYCDGIIRALVDMGPSLQRGAMVTGLLGMPPDIVESVNTAWAELGDPA